jgi:uncharacterized protein (DUF58 family)
MNTAIYNQPAKRENQDHLTPERILRHLELRVIRRLDGILQGDYRSLLYGAGLDFADLREYQAEDDIRYIDWNVTARMNTPYVREYVEDREITAWFLMDFSPSMEFGLIERPKETVLVDFVATMARLFTRNGNRVGAMFYSNNVYLTLPARGGRNQVLRLVNDMLRPHPATGSLTTDLTPLLETAVNTIKRRSLVFLISDFICLPGWERLVYYLSQKHDLVLTRLIDPREKDIPDIGVILVEDSETGEQIYVDTSDRRFRQRFHDAAVRRESQLEQVFKKAGVDALTLSTEDDLMKAILRFVELRKRTRRSQR